MKENGKIRIGIAGFGLMGQIHCANLVKMSDVEVVAVAALDRSQLDQGLGSVKTNIDQYRGDGFSLDSVRFYTDALEMCSQPDLDAVFVCLPTDAHMAATVCALDVGKHVFCEKPMALSIDQAGGMLAASQKAGRTLMIGHCLRFWPEYVRAAEIVRSGQYGSAVAASMMRCGPVPGWGADGNWFSNPARSGGAVVDMHIHDADVAVWLWGKPARISAGGAYRGVMPNYVHSRWTYADGPSVQFEATWEAVPSAAFCYGFRISFERACLEFDSRSGQGLILSTESGAERLELPGEQAYAHEAAYFVDCARNAKAPQECPPAQSLQTLECVLEESRQVAAACGKPCLF
jgi:1,5-anhydro-D-fructose reductase (1,5-anhydro-D-mannitol-forming)